MRTVTVWQREWLAIVFIGLVALPGAAQADTALEWLNRAAVAAKQMNFSGVYVYHHGEHIEVQRVLHRADASGEQEKVEVMDGTPRQFLRVNSDVYCYLPDGKNVRLERNTSRRFFPALLPNQPESLLDYYDAKLGGSERVAGRSCQILTLEPRDGYRYTTTLWLDKRTGLPLKSRVVNNNGGAVSMFVFSEIQIGKAPDSILFRNDLTGKRVINASVDVPVDVAWSIKPPPGYERVHAAVRSLPGKKSPVTHLVYSDGLSVLSMFVEPVNPQVERLHGLSAEGAIGIYAREVDGYTVTTLGEVPNLALIETGNSAKKQ
ncbi:MAG: MucB/RseB C-terminal domain-containing protein [Thiobacillus sp.]